MKNPFSFLTRKNLETSFGVLQSRFPVAGIIVVILTGLLYYIIQAEPDSIVYLRIVLSLIVTFFLSVGVSLFLEGKKVPYEKLWQGAPIVYGILFYTTIHPIASEWVMDSITFFVLHLVGFIALLFFAPYVRNLFYTKEQSVEYANYFSRIAWTLFMSAIVGGSLVALGFIAIASVFALFDLSSITDQSQYYQNWTITALSLVAPLYCLIHLPRVRDLEQRSYEINRFFSFLIRFVATPFIVLFFIILYAYSAKVLSNFQEWPKGMISWMVVGFSSFGFLTYIFSKSYEEESSMIALFRKYFPYAVPAQILMLGYAIYLRIAQYDLTMNRYFVVIFGVWLTIISLYYIISTRKSLTVIPATLTLIALLISVGPWSVFQFPITRQYNHLLQNLEKAGIYKDGVISKKKDEIDPELHKDIISGIQYICDFSRCEKIKILFAAQLVGKEAEYEKKWSSYNYNHSEYPGMFRWEIVKEVTDAIGISNNQDAVPDVKDKYITFSTEIIYDSRNNFPNIAHPINIVGYDTLVQVFTSDYTPPEGSIYITVNEENAELILHNYNGTDKTFSLQEFNKKLSDKYKNANNYVVDAADLSTVIDTDNLRLKLLLGRYSIKNPFYKAVEYSESYINVSGYALIKNK